MAIPRLVFSTTSSFEEKWKDSGSGADKDGAFYRSVPPDGFFSLGDYGQSNYGPPTGTVVVIKAENDTAANPLLKPPSDFAQIVNDKGSGADQDGSFWYPLPPPGYVPIGSVVQRGYDKPTDATSSYRCVRIDMVTSGELAGLIYADHGSGADQDMSIYRMKVTGVIYAHRGYDNPVGPFHQPVSISH